MRKDFYEALLAYRETAQGNKEWDTLDQEQQRYVDDIIRGMQRSGLNLPLDQKNKVEEM
jgi:Zn-dependent oligopeptidase